MADLEGVPYPDLGVRDRYLTDGVSGLAAGGVGRPEGRHLVRRGHIRGHDFHRAFDASRRLSEIDGCRLGLGQVPAWWLAERQYSVADDELGVHTERFTAAFRWDAVSRVTRVGDAYLLHLAGSLGWIDLPTGPLSDEQKAFVSTVLADHGLTGRRIMLQWLI